jgi:hypothetical protein
VFLQWDFLFSTCVNCGVPDPRFVFSHTAELSTVLDFVYVRDTATVRVAVELVTRSLAHTHYDLIHQCINSVERQPDNDEGCRWLVMLCANSKTENYGSEGGAEFLIHYWLHYRLMRSWLITVCARCECDCGSNNVETDSSAMEGHAVVTTGDSASSPVYCCRPRWGFWMITVKPVK